MEPDVDLETIGFETPEIDLRIGHGCQRNRGKSLLILMLMDCCCHNLAIFCCSLNSWVGRCFTASSAISLCGSRLTARRIASASSVYTLASCRGREIDP